MHYILNIAIHFINAWDKLTFQEQRIVTTLVYEPLKRIDIARRLDLTSGAIAGSLNSLQDKVLIELDECKYNISDSVLRMWLRNEYEKKGVYPIEVFNNLASRWHILIKIEKCYLYYLA
ncbi:hypothetical protein [Methanobrevibacter olleyae]|uniref:Archaeal ATPase n=1 Tax=Methanobrevibacter olleyae TaxID=294671 RepID=A0A126R0U9_METOL|nr:hypothetical protein [Methanobrevibacter olleyae]AMK15245.1 archaeal ATPase [Methanobrevibacter olleyae]